MDKLTVYMMAAATAIAIALALLALHIEADNARRLRAIEYLIFGTDESVS